MRTLFAALSACLIAAVTVSSVQVDQTSPSSATATATATTTKPTQVLFMCPHGAAKSVLASAYFQRLAKERGLNVIVDAAGTDPDPAVSAAVVEHLTRNGYAVPIAKPRRVTADDMHKADIVVSLGCDLNGLPPARDRLLRWDDVPGPGENFAGASEAIRKHAEELVEELVRATR
jgi:protein-tyrosine-phosphatase